VRSLGVGGGAESLGGWTNIQREFPFLLVNMKSHSGISPQPLRAIKQEMANHIDEYLQYAINWRQTLTGGPSNWMSFWGAVRRLRLSVYKARQVLNRGMLNVRTISDGGNLRYLIRSDDLAQLRTCVEFIKTKTEVKKESGLVSIRESSRALTASCGFVSDLIDANLVETVQVEWARFIKASSLLQLVEQLSKMSSNIDRNDELIELAACSRVTTAKRSDVIKKVMQGEVRLFRLRRGTGLGQFMVKKEALKSSFPIIAPGHLTLAQASRDERFSRDYLRGCIQLGILRCVPHPRGKGKLICQSELAKLQRRYVSSKELAARYGCGYSVISKELKSTGKLIAVGPSAWLRKAATDHLDRAVPNGLALDLRKATPQRGRRGVQPARASEATRYSVLRNKARVAGS
jgi:hypothetical protein